MTSAPRTMAETNHAELYTPVPSRNANVPSSGDSVTAITPPMLVDSPASNDSATGHHTAEPSMSAAMSSDIDMLLAVVAAQAGAASRCRPSRPKRDDVAAGSCKHDTCADKGSNTDLQATRLFVG